MSATMARLRLRPLAQPHGKAETFRAGYNENQSCEYKVSMVSNMSHSSLIREECSWRPKVNIETNRES